MRPSERDADDPFADHIAQKPDTQHADLASPLQAQATTHISILKIHVVSSHRGARPWLLSKRLGRALRMNPEQARAVEPLNCAWTYLDQLVDEVRESGRAATDGKLARGFANTYVRRERLNVRRKGESAADEPQDPTLK